MVAFPTLAEGHNSPTDWATELFKPFSDSESLLVLIEKN